MSAVGLLTGRSAIHPRLKFHMRASLRGTMTVRGVLYDGTPPTSNPTLAWNPDAVNPADRAPAGWANGPETKVTYLGRARVQPNFDWRARDFNWSSETVVVHAVRIEIDFRGNELTDGDVGVLPSVNVGDIFRVTDVGNGGDTQLLQEMFIVRSMVASSNSLVRTFLCDVDLTKVGEPVG